MVQRVDGRAQLLHGRPGQVLGQVQPLGEVGGSTRSHRLRCRHTSICIPADSTPGSRCRAAPARCGAARSRAPGGVAPHRVRAGWPASSALRRLAHCAEQRALERSGTAPVLQRDRGLAARIRITGLVGGVQCAVSGRPRRERADDAPVEFDRHVRVVALDHRQPELSQLTAQDVVQPVEHHVGQGGSRILCAGNAFERVRRRPSASRMRWRGRASGSAPSASASSTHRRPGARGRLGHRPHQGLGTLARSAPAPARWRRARRRHARSVARRRGDSG